MITRGAFAPLAVGIAVIGFPSSSTFCIVLISGRFLEVAGVGSELGAPDGLVSWGFEDGGSFFGPEVWGVDALGGDFFCVLVGK